MKVLTMLTFFNDFHTEQSAWCAPLIAVKAKYVDSWIDHQKLLFYLVAVWPCSQNNKGGGESLQYLRREYDQA